MSKLINLENKSAFRNSNVNQERGSQLHQIGHQQDFLSQSHMSWESSSPA